MKLLNFLVVLVAFVLLHTGCDDTGPAAPTPDAVAETTTDTAAETTTDTAATDAAGDSGIGVDVPPPLLDDLDMTAEDFECLTNWTKVRRFYVTNKAGRLEETLAVANSTTGGTYPVGTVIQLVPFEAMVKRKAGWAPEANDWEFFALKNTADGTTIADRGTTGVVNQFGGECLPCHTKAAAQWDLICETDHGCDPLGITEFVIESFVNSDERCK